jgi:5'-nucleotidase
MSVNFDGILVVAISSRALFDLEEGHRIYERDGIDAYCEYQIKHENDTLKRGVAFTLVQKLLALNEKSAAETHVEVVLISRNSADTGLRIFNSIAHYGLNITRAAFTGGNSPWSYAQSFKADLFLSADPQDVANALGENMAAATILPHQPRKEGSEIEELRVAFDGDAVIFSDQSEQVFQQKGLEEVTQHEQSAANDPLPGGPFKSFLAALNRIQTAYDAKESPIRTALFTARAAPSHERVIRTLRAWNIRIDEAVFLGGMDKGEFLKNFQADIYFDDQQGHCESTRQHVPTGHVPHGVSNVEEG